MTGHPSDYSKENVQPVRRDPKTRLYNSEKTVLDKKYNWLPMSVIKARASKALPFAAAGREKLRTCFTHR